MSIMDGNIVLKYWLLTFPTGRNALIFTQNQINHLLLSVRRGLKHKQIVFGVLSSLSRNYRKYTA